MSISVRKSFAAGILIGIGVIINLTMSIPALGALLFSFGLLTIIQMQLPLYTGKIGFFPTNDWVELSFILFANLYGISLVIALYGLAHPEFCDMITAAAQCKFDKSMLQMFIDGIFCGALIHFAVKNKISYITIMAIMIFILIGAEHCIADFPYLLFNCTTINIWKYLAVVIGNSIGALGIERLVKNNG